MNFANRVRKGSIGAQSTCTNMMARGAAAALATTPATSASDSRLVFSNFAASSATLTSGGAAVTLMAGCCGVRAHPSSTSRHTPVTNRIDTRCEGMTQTSATGAGNHSEVMINDVSLLQYAP